MSTSTRRALNGCAAAPEGPRRRAARKKRTTATMASGPNSQPPSPSHMNQSGPLPSTIRAITPIPATAAILPPVQRMGFGAPLPSSSGTNSQAAR